MPRYYPICLEIANRACLVVGGGAVGLRKARALLAHHGRVRVVAAEALPPLRRLAEKGRIILHERPYRASDLRGIQLVFVATDDAALNRRIAREARRRRVPINIADVPALCDFIVPSIVRRGKLIVAVSTEGACPALSKRLRKALEKQFDRAYGDYVEMLAGLRKRIIARTPDSRAAARLLERLLDEDFLRIIRRKGRRAAEAHARKWLAARLDNRPATLRS